MATDLYALAEQVEDEAGFLRFLAALAADWPAETVRPQPAGLGERQHRWLPRCRRDLGRGLPRRPAGLFQAGECLAARGAADAGGQVL
ncbi:hypothetical protein [Pseudomonas aeruginosa]|uniref:hypothetical protein n=1 Tax=Pseudomonas aeruginosa TaxID=287 RepID=UPI001E2F8CAF|nr:hypothetical protein [Pseudomonas aeruginosa]